MTMDTCGTICAKSVAELRQCLKNPLNNLSDSIHREFEIVVLVAELGKHNHERMIAQIFKQSLMAVEPKEASSLFDLIGNVLGNIDKKFVLAFEPLLPGIVRHIREKLKKDDKSGQIVELLLQRCGWDGLVSSSTLDEINLLMHDVTDSEVAKVPEKKSSATENEKKEPIDSIAEICMMLARMKLDDVSSERTFPQKVNCQRDF